MKASEKQPGRAVLTREGIVFVTSAETSAEARAQMSVETRVVRDQLTELIPYPSQCRKVVVAQELAIEVESEEVEEDPSQDEVQDGILALPEWE